MVKRAFTLIEAIFVIVILSFILLGGFQIISHIYKRNFIAIKSAEFEKKTQESLDYLSAILYNRIPLTIIGYNVGDGDFKPLSLITEDEEDKYKVVEWIGECSECKRELNLSGFVDLYDSDRFNHILKAKDFNSNFVAEILRNKFLKSGDDNKTICNNASIIFAGSFDRGEEGALFDYNNSFGWHNHDHKYVYTILNISQNGDDSDIEINLTSPARIYEKFYFADSGYTLALKRDLNQSLLSQCKDLNLSKLSDNTLLLFYNYRPWKKETYCADNRGSYEGNVTVLATNVASFRVRSVNSHLEILLQMQTQKDDINVSISKQKVVF